MATLSVEFRAKIERLERELKKARQDLAKTGDAAEKAAGKTKGFGGKVPKNFNKTSKAAGSANASLLEFNRVIQDAPFGIQGVANNLTQLTSSLGNTVTQAGGAGAALRQIGASFLGPAGIIFAVSALTSALVSFGPEIKDFILNVSEAEKVQRDFADATKEAQANVKGEISVLDSLLNVAKDVNRSLDDRQRAIAKINDEYGEYLPNITTENVDTEKVTKALDKYTEALLRNAKIKGAQDLISKEYQKILELQASSALDNVGALDVLSAAFSSVGNAGLVSSNLITSGIKNQNEEISETEKRIKAVQSLLNELISTDISEDGIFSSVGGSVKAQADKVIKESLENVPSPRIPEGTFSIIGNPLGDVAGPTFAAASVTADKELTKFEKRLVDFEAASSQIITGGILDGFRAFGNGIAEALRGGEQAFANFGKAIFAAIGNFLTQLGEAAILTGIGMLAINKAFATPLAAIAAGTALVAAGAAFSKATASAPGGGFTGGGSGFTGTNTSVSTQPLATQQLEFVVRGKNLVAVANRNLRQNNRTLADPIS